MGLDIKEKKAFDVNRMRLTLGDAKGPAMGDKRQKVSEFFAGKTKPDDNVYKLVFKDLGR